MAQEEAVGPELSVGAGVLLTCDDCGGAVMAGIDDRGRPQLLHAVPVCEAFATKALELTQRWVEGLGGEPLSGPPQSVQASPSPLLEEGHISPLNCCPEALDTPDSGA